jgi:hypothetical protein
LAYIASSVALCLVVTIIGHYLARLGVRN